MKVEYLHTLFTIHSVKLYWRLHIFPTHLHGVKLGVFGNQPGQVLDAVQGGGGAAGLQDEPPPRDEHRALWQHVGVHLGVLGGRDDRAVHDREEVFQSRPEIVMPVIINISFLRHSARVRSEAMVLLSINHLILKLSHVFCHPVTCRVTPVILLILWVSGIIA